ncbi:hypothetical protein [Streptococcus suis]|nr:hypothetical protein [Streptococcus suis]
MTIEEKYEKDWEQLVIQEKELVHQLDKLVDEKRKLGLFGEDVMEKAKEGLYHVSQLLDRAKTASDYQRRQDLLDRFVDQAYVLDEGLQDRRDQLVNREKELNQTLAEVVFQKQKTYYQLEEARATRKESSRW